MKLLRVFLFFVVLLVSSCISNNTEEKLLGAWVPEHNTWTSLVFFPDSAWVFVGHSIITYSYQVENEKLMFYNSDKNIQSLPNSIVNENPTISWLKDDSLVLHLNSPLGGLEVSYQKVKLLTDRFDKIQFSFFNGWQTSKTIEIDSAGNFTAWENNAWTEKTYKMTGVLEDSDFTKLLWGANYIYSLPASFKLSRHGCDDCPQYGISLYRKGTVKSFYVSESKKPRVTNLVFSTLLNLIKNSEKLETNSSFPRLKSDTHLVKDTIVIERQ